MTFRNLRLREIADPMDDLLLPWIDLYETAFPPNERVLVSYILRLLRAKDMGTNKTDFLFSVLDGKDLVGMMLYQLLPEAAAVWLWYLAIIPEARNQGIGSFLYRELLGLIDHNQFHVLVFETNIPEDALTEEQRQYDDLRIQFFQRNGAYLLRGIGYLQDVGAHQPRTPMHLMVHPFQSIDARSAFAFCKQVFPEAMSQTGELTLENPQIVR